MIGRCRVDTDRESERAAIVCDMADDSVLARSSLPGDIPPPKKKKKKETYIYIRIASRYSSSSY